VNFNPQNEQGILGLVAALKSGMSPDTAYGLFQGIQQDQASQIAARQERLGGLADLLMGAASQGTPYAGAEALADAAPGPMGPAVQQMLAALYPTGEQGPAPTNASGAQMDFPSGSRPGEPLAMAYGAPDAGPTAMSPTFVPQGPSPTEAIAMQEMEQQQAITPQRRRPRAGPSISTSPRSRSPTRSCSRWPLTRRGRCSRARSALAPTT
jgi:hypothetical protein